MMFKEIQDVVKKNIVKLAKTSYEQKWRVSGKLFGFDGEDVLCITDSKEIAVEDICEVINNRIEEEKE